MFKAHYNYNAQTANDKLVHIRNSEVQYFTEFFTSFGIKAALIAGFQLKTISQVQVLYELEDKTYQYLYWVFTACSICSSVHVILCCCYMVIFGQGLCLRGPVGSMVRALNGMVVEQQHILMAFRWNVTFLLLSTIFEYFVVMKIYGALACTIITFLGALCFQNATKRISIRFQLPEIHSSWREEQGITDYDFSVGPKRHVNFELMEDDGRSVASKTKKSSRRSSQKESFFGKLRGNKKNKKISLAHFEMGDRDRDTIVIDEGVHHLRSGAGYGISDVIHEGYLTMNRSKNTAGNANSTKTFAGLKTKIKATIKVNSQSLVRRYVVLSGRLLVIYKSREAYEDNPEYPANRRPFELDDYYLIGQAQGSMHSHYSIFLTPAYEIDHFQETGTIYGESTRAGEATAVKEIEFRCDTEDEMNDWTRSLNKVMRPLPAETAEKLRHDYISHAQDLETKSAFGGRRAKSSASSAALSQSLLYRLQSQSSSQAEPGVSDLTLRLRQDKEKMDREELNDQADGRDRTPTFSSTAMGGSYGMRTRSVDSAIAPLSKLNPYT